MILKPNHNPTGCCVCDKNQYDHSFFNELEQLYSIVRNTSMHRPVLWNAVLQHVVNGNYSSNI